MHPRRPEPTGQSFYNLFDDWDLIVSSFLSQYGIRLATREFATVGWDEFRSLLIGLSPDTALGRVVAIRSETDAEIIKNFTTDQRRIYDEWRQKEAAVMTDAEFSKGMADLERMFMNMCR